MKIAIVRERFDGEKRVAATPETVGKLIALGGSVFVETAAGLGSRILDADYHAAGATITTTAEEALNGAEVLLAVRRPDAAFVSPMARGALVIGALDPYGSEADIAALGAAGVTAVAMEFMPRITRAQVMDILSSQANLAGYQSVIDAAAEFERAMPMMMTAAGTVRPAKVFVMGAGVAGLQAIATARRLGAVVTATDVRPAAKEQVESLGAKFIAVEDDEFKQAETAGGYAKQMSAEYQAKQAELTAAHIAKQDIVITTALIPGRPAPRLVSAAMVEAMAPGSVIVDLAAERGGNVELTVPGKVIEHNAVKIIGHLNVQGRIPTTASQLYSRNLLAFFDTLVDKTTKTLAINWDDELVKATVLTRDGKVVHPNFTDASALNANAASAIAALPPIDPAAPLPTGPQAVTVTPTAGPDVTLPPVGSVGIITPARKRAPRLKAPEAAVIAPAMADVPPPVEPGVQPSAPQAPKRAPRPKAITPNVGDAANGAEAIAPTKRVRKPIAPKPAATEDDQ